jgi:hypothetical protein
VQLDGVPLRFNLPANNLPAMHEQGLTPTQS